MIITSKFMITHKAFTGTNEAPAENYSEGQGQGSPCSCQEEIDSLKCTVKQLILQTKKQNQAIMKQKQVVTDIRTCLRNFAISLATCCDEDDGEENMIMDGLEEFSEIGEAAGSTDEDPPLLGNPKVTSSHRRRATQLQDYFQDDDNCSPVTILNCTGNYSVLPFAPSVSIETCPSDEVGSNFKQRANEEETVDMDDINFQEDDDDKDSSYVPDESEEEEPGQEMADERNCQGDSSSSIKSSVKKTKSGRFPCCKSSKSYNLKKHLQRHMQHVHSKNISKVNCHLCAKVFRDKWHLKNHIQSAHEGIRYKCAYCPGQFTRKADAQRHEDQIHKKAGGQPTHQCKICGIHLLHSHSLNRHMSKVHKKFRNIKELHGRKSIHGTENYT